MVTPQRVDGIDISHHQSGKINFEAAKKAGLKWVYHKATEGSTFKDKNYAKRRAEAKKAGLPFGAYHFARPNADGKDARTEAKFFLDYAKPVPGDLRPALDLETRENLKGMPLVKWADEFCDEVHKRTGVWPIVYTPYELSTELEKRCLFWRPRYNNKNTPPKLPWDIWQFSNGQSGVPKSFTGFGNVDLNTSKVDVSKMLIPKPKPKPKPKKTALLKFAHLSMQFSDSDAQIEKDLRTLFGRGYDVVTGTEMSHKTTDRQYKVLVRVTKEMGYLLSKAARYDTWVAVKKTLVLSDWKTDAEYALPPSGRIIPKPPGRWGPKAVTWASWNMGPTFGRFAVGSVHNLTWRGTGKASLKNSTDKVYARKMEAWRKSLPAETEAFIGGDFNRNDKQYDVFQGQARFFTASDELRKWPNTGHGPIDAVARYRDSTRVKAKRIEVLDDKELFFHTDHYLVEVDYEVTAI